MAYGQAGSYRPIAGAVATVGVSDRVVFLRKTYAHLGAALIAFALIAGGMLRWATDTSLAMSRWALQGRWTWMLVLVLFMVVGKVAESLARSESSRGLQYAGLGLAVVAEAVLLQPLLWVVMYRVGHVNALATGVAAGAELTGAAAAMVLRAVVITLAVFVGLTATVFITRKDFSFLRGALSIAAFAMLGVILASMLFGFQLGAVFLGIGVVVLAGYILLQTSLVMAYFPTSGYVGAALMLFSTVATLFWYVLQLLMEMSDRR